MNSYAVNIFNDQNAIFILRHSTLKLLPHKKRFTSIDTFRLSHYRNRKRLSLNYDKEHSLKGTFQGLVTLRCGATNFILWLIKINNELKKSTDSNRTSTQCSMLSIKHHRPFFSITSDLVSLRNMKFGYQTHSIEIVCTA